MPISVGGLKWRLGGHSFRLRESASITKGVKERIKGNVVRREPQRGRGESRTVELLHSQEKPSPEPPLASHWFRKPLTDSSPKQSVEHVLRGTGQMGVGRWTGQSLWASSQLGAIPVPRDYFHLKCQVRGASNSPSHPRWAPFCFCQQHLSLPSLQKGNTAQS